MPSAFCLAKRRKCQNMNRLAVLRKYSMSPLDFVEPKTFEGIIKFTVDGRITIEKGAYLTTNEFGSADEAHRYLAITYSPKFENIFELNKEDITRVELKNPYLGYEPTRIWPAFGLHGGGCEIILTKGKLNCSKKIERFPDAGKPDTFHQDSQKSDKIFVSRLAQILWDWLQKRKKELPGKEGPAMKIMDGLGVVISWLGVPSYKRYAISCAYKENENKDFVILKFWGYVWDDKNQERVLSIPVIRDCSFPSRINEIKEKIKQYQAPFGDIENILSEIHNCLIPIAQNFDDCNNDTIELPFYVSL